jgi:hypothetical protein
VKIYVLTRQDAAEPEGFHDECGGVFMSGVWASECPQLLDLALRDVHCFEVRLTEEQLHMHEWIHHEGRPREWLVPVALMNSAPRRELTLDEARQLI